MSLTEQETVLLARRSQRMGLWQPVGAIVLAALVLFCGWLVWGQPLLIDVPEGWARREQHAISSSTLAAALVVFVFVGLSNGKKRIRTIRRLTGSAE